MSITHYPFTRRSLLAGAGVAFAGSAFARRARADNNRVLTLLLHPEPVSLVSLSVPSGGTIYATGKTTEGLLTYGFDLAPQAQLAVAWEVSPDGLNYRFKLRENVYWHDGKDFTSADAAFSIEAARAVHPRGRGTFAHLKQIETPDAHTLVLRLSEPAPYLLTAFAASETPILPKHLYGDSDPALSPNNNAPIGTGPFVFESWERGSHAIFRRNAKYWDTAKPQIDQLILRFSPDAQARAIALETGEVDLAPANPVATSNVDRLMALPHLGFETNGYQYQNNITRLEFNLERPLFKDVRVRRAFAHAIDKQRILDLVWFGHGQVIDGPINPALVNFHAPGLPVYEYSPAKAEALLDAAGLPRSSNGIRASITIDPSPTAHDYRVGAEVIKDALAKIGIEVTVRLQDTPAYVKRVYTDREFDVTFSAISNLYDPTVGVQRLYWSKNFRPGVPFSNGSGYRNDTVDKILEAAAIEVDTARRQQLFYEFQRIVVNDLPDIAIVAPHFYTIYNRRITGHTQTADGITGNLANVRLAQS
jgi:peptide/nickel transport system substrate-binding protein